jgi:hypothetical protein
VERLIPPGPQPPPPVVQVTMNLTRIEALLLYRLFGKMSENDMRGLIKDGEAYPQNLALRAYDLFATAANEANK